MKEFKTTASNAEFTNYLFKDRYEFFKWIDTLFDSKDKDKTEKTDLMEVLEYIGEEIHKENMFITESADGYIIVSEYI